MLAGPPEPEQHVLKTLNALIKVSHPHLLALRQVYSLAYEVTPGSAAGMLVGGMISSASRIPATTPYTACGGSYGRGSGGGLPSHTFLTGVLPRRERYKRVTALLVERFPSISLRDVLNRK